MEEEVVVEQVLQQNKPNRHIKVLTAELENFPRLLKSTMVVEEAVASTQMLIVTLILTLVVKEV